MKFSFLLSLTWKNLSRHARRTVITASALAFGIAIFVWIDAFLLGASLDSERNLLWYETGSAKIFNREYWENIDNLPLKHSFEIPAKLNLVLEDMRIPRTPRTTFTGEVFFGEGSLPAKIIGIDPATDGEVFHLEESLMEGGRFVASDQAGILIGEWLAKDLGAQLEDFVDIRTRTRFKTMQTMELQIVGILNCPNPVINKGTVFLPLSLVDIDMQMEGRVSEIVLSLPTGKKQDRVIQELSGILEESFPELVVVPWEVLARDFVALAEAKSSGSGLVVFLILIIAAVGISNTMLIAVYERVREIGMMRALGMGDSSIGFAFLLEAGGIGLIGSLIGLAIGSLATYWIVNWGIDYSNLVGDLDIGYRVHGVFRGAWNPSAMIGSVFLGTLVSMIIAIIPALRALKMKITDCLRYE